nr:PREDICTED: uncharacterized protein LOC105669667 [Linepithema humile]
MRLKIEKYVHNCIDCILAERKSGKMERWLYRTQMKLREDSLIKDIIATEEVASHQQEREKSRELARQAIAKIQEENKRTYNKKKKVPPQYRENDLVTIKRTQGGPGLKFAAKYLGPYRVKKTLCNERYIVEKIGEVEGPRITSTAADHMKPRDNTLPEKRTSEDICQSDG